MQAAKQKDDSPLVYHEQYILMVKDLKKYFPIKGGLLNRVVGQIKAVDGVTFNLKRGTTMGSLSQIPIFRFYLYPKIYFYHKIN